MLNQSELKKVYRIIKAYDEGLLVNPSEEWEMDHYGEPLAEKSGLKPILKKIEKVLPDATELKKAVLRRCYDTFNNDIDESVYNKINYAFNNKRVVEIDYFDMASGEARKRKIDVYHKTMKYVTAYCHLRKAMRKFRTSRIVSAKVLSKSYNIPEDFDKKKY